MTVFLSQWLCPNRHAAIGGVWDDAGTNREEVVAEGELVFTRGGLNRRCGICGGPLVVEHAVTRFRTLEDARREFERLQARNVATRAALELLGLTADQKKPERN
jgi:hypothetical protein